MKSRIFHEIFVANLGSGTLTLANGDVGKVSAPCADFGNAQKELWLDLDVRCTFTMDDGSLYKRLEGRNDHG